MKITSRISFRASGDDIIGFINAVRKSDIIFFIQYCKSGEYKGKIYLKDLKKIKIIAEDYNINFSIDKIEGKAYTVMKYRSRYGIFAGIIFMALFIFYFSNTVVKIDINGNEKIAESEIADILESCGVKQGAYIPDIDFDECEYQLVLKIDRIKWTGVRNRGGQIIVDVHEKEDAPKTVKSNIPCNIISNKDAVVVSLKTFRGQNEISEGDAIGKGDIIISGIITNGSGDFSVIHAEGEIIGEYSEEQKFIYYFERERKNYDKIYKEKFFNFFGIKIPVSFSRISFSEADCSQKTEYFKFLGYELPFGITEKEYRIFNRETVLETPEMARAELEKQIEIYEKNFYSKCEIKNKNVFIEEFDNRLECTAEYIIQGEIGIEKGIFISSDD